MTNHEPGKSTDAAIWDRRFAEHPWPSDPDARLVELVSPLPAGRALDLGCGTGRNALWLARNGWDVTGVDASAVGLAQAASGAKSIGVTLSLVEADLSTYQPASFSFDLVVVANMHFATHLRQGLYERAVSAVAPGGHLFIVGHHVDSFGRSGPPERDRLFSVELVTEFARGLEIGLVEREERWVNGEPEPLIDVVLWARRAITNDSGRS
ncbi:MAG: class I SAM-dependent methyltransferase [Acidimicrobiaceae bacterium]|nr:class I SAM-dependent methyltransferase [Acidimicrobiaceae bacterium]